MFKRRARAHKHPSGYNTITDQAENMFKNFWNNSPLTALTIGGGLTGLFKGNFAQFMTASSAIYMLQEGAKGANPKKAAAVMAGMVLGATGAYAGVGKLQGLAINQITKLPSLNKVVGEAKSLEATSKLAGLAIKAMAKGVQHLAGEGFRRDLSVVGGLAGASIISKLVRQSHRPYARQRAEIAHSIMHAKPYKTIPEDEDTNFYNPHHNIKVDAHYTLTSGINKKALKEMFL